MIGQKFGRLLVIAAAKTRHNRAFWVCQCDCGQTTEAMGKSLRNGKKKSCGCLAKELSRARMPALALSNTLPPGEAARNLLYSTYRWHAEKRGFDFLLTKEEFANLTSQTCFYCGSEPKQLFGINLNGQYTYNGVDRLENDKGYTPENSVPCCGTCNDMKRTRSVADFISACIAVAKYQKP